MAGYRIRRAGVGDVPAVACLHLASYRAGYRGLLPAGFLAALDLGDRERRWLSSIRDPARVTLIAENRTGPATAVPGDVPPVPGALIGLAEVGPCRDAGVTPGTGELYALHVARAHWRHGIGRSLHDRALGILVARGSQRATLWVLAGNARARAFYEALGWSPDGHERHRVLREAGIHEVRYRKGPLAG